MIGQLCLHWLDISPSLSLVDCKSHVYVCGLGCGEIMSLVFFLNLVLGRRCGVQNYISKKVSTSQSEFYVC